MPTNEPPACDRAHQSELRVDPLTEEWVTIVGARQNRPNLAAAPITRENCPFCVGGIEAPEPYEVKAFENRWPPLRPGEPLETDVTGALTNGFGLTRLPARGAAEVVLYSPDHDASLGSLGAAGVRRVIDLWAERTHALESRTEIKYVLVFENRGAEVGATIPHPHGQIYAFPFVPPVPMREAEVASRRGCPICAAVREEIDAGDRLVAMVGNAVAYVPFASGWPYGLLVATTEHVASLPDLDGSARDDAAAVLADVLARYDRLFARPFPYMLWIHGGVHVHVHLAPPLRGPRTLRYVAAGELGSGTLSNPVVPEVAAIALRNA
ncbi:MAG: galactose-1-phosphate uridylyltransferase [Actinomycetota bacterium]|nr:galactose-1-phosphate uridylyltransferase [Actinomycetota bacterium]